MAHAATQELDGELREALAGERTPIFLATIGPDGQPNVVPVISIEPWDRGTLIFGDFMIRKTKRNLELNSGVAVGVLTQDMSAWWLRGRFQGFERTGPKVDKINSSDMFRYNAYTGIRSAGTIAVQEVSAKQTIKPAEALPRLAACGLRRALGAALPAKGPMPARVREKFARIKAAKFVAWAGDDGSPHVRAGVSLLPVGAGQLAVAKADLEPGAPAPGARVAAAIITFDPIAYQVKGTLIKYKSYAGVSVARIDVDEVYSASPPLPGERIN